MNDYWQTIIKILEKQDYNFSVEDLLDAIWITQYIKSESRDARTRSDAAADTSQIHKEMQTDSQLKDTISEKMKKDISKDEELQEEIPSLDGDELEESDLHDADIYLPKSTSVNGAGMGSKLLRIPAAPILTDALQLSRALRPFMQRMPSKINCSIDEEKTASQIAEEGIWTPALVPVMERWFEVELIVDAGASMDVWHGIGYEFLDLLRWMGAFRNIRTWSITTDDPQPRLYVGLQHHRISSQERSPSELTNTNGRRLILVLTDCVSPAWHSGGMLKSLNLWATKGPAAIIQVFPFHLWSRTALHSFETVFLFTSSPALSNIRLPYEFLYTIPEPDENNEKTILPVPVVSIDPVSIANWTKLVTGVSGDEVLGCIFRQKDEELAIGQKTAPKLLPEKCIKLFWQLASPTAIRLALLISASPAISLQVIRIIRNTMLPEATHVHEAEIILGGLLKHTHHIDESSFKPEDVQYEFRGDIRWKLLENLPISESIKVLDVVSVYIEEHIGNIRNFRAVLAVPSKAEGTISIGDHPIARITGEILQSLGGDYARLVKRGKKRIKSIEEQLTVQQLKKKEPESDTALKDSKDREKKYRVALKKLLDSAWISGLPDSRGVRFDDIYVPLRISEFWQSENRIDFHKKKKSIKKERHLTPEEVMKRALKKFQMMLILGDPCSGKTTLLKYYALKCLNEGTDNHTQLGFREKILPFYLPLRELEFEDENVGPTPLQQNLAKWSKRNLLNISAKQFQKWLQSRKTLVMLDGLDEIPSREQCNKVCLWLRDACKSFKNAFFVVTSRSTGYRKLDGIELNIPHLRGYILNFSIQQQEVFLRKWFRAAFLTESRPKDIHGVKWIKRADQHSQSVIEFLKSEDNKAVQKLTAVPMMLQIIAILWRDRLYLPKTRSELMDAALNYLLDFRDRHKGIEPLITASQSRILLSMVALWMQSELHRDEVTKEEMHQFIQPILNTFKSQPNASTFCLNLKDRAGLIIEYGPDHYTFRHKAFREFLAAQRLLHECGNNQERIKILVDSFLHDWWEETLRFFINMSDAHNFDMFMHHFFQSNISSQLDANKQTFLQVLVSEAPQRKIDSLVNSLNSGKLNDNQVRYVMDCLKTIGTEGAIKSIHDADKSQWSKANRKYAEEITGEPSTIPISKYGSSEITILHLSEIHFKRKQYEHNKTFQQDVISKMINSIEVHMSRVDMNPDFVSVTGDIAFSGHKQEYDEAILFFHRLKTILPKKPEFLIVPGNHDIDRRDISKFFSLHGIVQNGYTDMFLEDKKEINTHIIPRFKNFRRFVDNLNPYLYLSADDYYWVKDFKDKDVSFLGLNSCWACENENDRNNITLGYPQLINALNKTNTQNKILLMHHPPLNWFNEKDFSRYRGELFRNIGLILHSHDHIDDALVFKDPSNTCICLGANASYTKDKHGFIGFQFIRVTFNREGIALKVWPYRLDTRDQVRFVPDIHRYEGQEGKPYFELKTIEQIKNEPKKSISLEIPKDYKEWVREFHSTLPTDQLARKGDVVLISLPQVYIPMETANPFHKPMDEKKMKEGRGPISEDEEESGEPKEPAYIDIEKLIGRMNCILLEGNVGMGKTTLVKHLAFTLTQDSGPQSIRGYLPVLIFLKDFWPLYQKEMKKESPTATFVSLLEVYFKKVQCPLSTGIVKDFLKQGRALLLLDSLDEVPEEIRSQLVDMVHRFRFEYSKNEAQEKHEKLENKGNRFLITARPHGIDAKGLECLGDYHQKIEYLDDKKVEDFISRWFQAVSGQVRGFDDLTAGDMISEIRLHEHAAVFIRNPLLLTALCIFYLVGGKRIPDQRADLYDRIVTNLLYRRFHDPLALERVNQVREFLMHLAYTMQTRNVKSIEPYEAKEVLKQELPLTPGESPKEYKKRLDQLFKEIEPVCGLLNRQISGDIEFVHLTFQEFMAAKHMLDMDINYKEYLDDPWWEETLLLYTGLMNLEMKKRSNGIVLEIINLKPTRLQLLGCKALRDFQTSKREEPVVKSVKEKLTNLINSNAPLEERFEAGDILGTLGDPRIDILSPPMVHVDAGEFTRGSDEYESEKPIHQVYLDEFMMGKYPVTNREFKEFIRDGGYNNKDLWTPEGWKWKEKENIFEPGLWHDRKWNGPNFPVVGVSWYEAAAYARWLSQKTGENYALPTEARWEKAARGTRGLKYPWGNDFDKSLCNSGESGLERTSPVGISHNGRSPYGCLDMAGNVWEWCADWYDEKYYHKSPTKNPMGPVTGSIRILRGGSWSDRAGACASAIRSHDKPENRSHNIGFRLARSF